MRDRGRHTAVIMVHCMALLLYGAPMRAATHLCHTHETDLSVIHSHANARVCLEVSAWASLKPRPPGAWLEHRRIRWRSIPKQDTSCHPSEQAQASHQVGNF